jgi:hypothetical protein
MNGSENSLFVRIYAVKGKVIEFNSGYGVIDISQSIG